MNISKLTLENFKCFKECVDFDFSKITILTGANSSGKSSLINSILGVLQSPDFPFHYAVNGKFVNMGDFREIVNEHDTSKSIQIKMQIKNGATNKVELSTFWRLSFDGKPELTIAEIDSGYYEICYDFNHKIVKLHYNSQKDPKLKNADLNKHKEILKNLFDLFESNNLKSSDKTSIYSEFLSEYGSSQDIEFRMSVKNKYDDIGYSKMFLFSQLEERYNSFLSGIRKECNYIGPTRIVPERTYLETNYGDSKIGVSGQGAYDLILAWEKNKSPKFKELMKSLQELGILYKIHTKRIKGGRYEIDVKVNKESVMTSISDVGSAVSQLLPILVNDLYIEGNSTLFISQPELHLHPSVQANLGDYFITQMAKGKNYIIETHSEYLLNRLRLGIVKGKLKESDVRVYYFSQIDGDTKKYEIKFHADGRISGAPEDFFETYMIDVMNIAMDSIK